MYLNGATKNEQFMWVGTYAIARRYRIMRLRRVLGKQLIVVNGTPCIKCKVCEGTGNNYNFPISGCSKCNGDGYEILQRNRV